MVLLWIAQLAFNPPGSPSSSSSAPCSPADGEDALKSRACLTEAAGVSLDGGVLDAKWCQQPIALGGSDAALLACATSTGRLGLYTLSFSLPSSRYAADAGDDAQECAQLQHSSSSDASDSLLLSLDWSGGGIADAKVERTLPRPSILEFVISWLLL